MNKLYNICLSGTDNLSDLKRVVISLSWVVSVAARNTDYTLIRVLDNTVVSAISFSVEVILNLNLIVLRCYTMILLTLKVSHNIIFLRINIDIVILYCLVKCHLI